MATRAGGRGFWPGLLTGLLLAVGAALALAFAFPPVSLQQPEVDPTSLVAPPAPGAPEAAAPVPALPARLLPEPTGAPLIEGAPKLEAAPAEPGAAGAASLVPRPAD
jgi:hypothetical protein